MDLPQDLSAITNVKPAKLAWEDYGATDSILTEEMGKQTVGGTTREKLKTNSILIPLLVFGNLSNTFTCWTMLITELF